MWFTVIFFSLIAFIAAGVIWDSRKERKLGRRRSRWSLLGDPGYHGSGSYSAQGDSGSASVGDCGSSGGGGGDGGGC